jgi:hypothetical protein
MILRATSLPEKILFGELPDGYPTGHPSDPKDGIPLLGAVNMDLLPKTLVACNDLGRSENATDSGVHFYKADRVFISAITKPLSWVNRLDGFGCVLTPDISLGDGMYRWQRVRNTVLSRATGAVWQSRGLNVIPSLRWRDESDYDFVAAGVPKNSIFAVSNYASRRSLLERRHFLFGAHEMIERLQPQVVFVYGSLDSSMHFELSKKTQILVFEDSITKMRRQNSKPKIHGTFDF